MADNRGLGVPFPHPVIPDEGAHRLIQHEEQHSVACSHSLEFWLAVTSSLQDGTRIVMQWCTRCADCEFLTWEEYQARKVSGDE